MAEHDDPESDRDRPATVYGDVKLIADRLGLYVDEMLAPGNAKAQEAYLRYAGMGMAWNVKGGQFHLPFGWRLQDNTAFVRLVSGIGMMTPDMGIEVGLERSAWSAQLALTQGPRNAGTGSGHQATGQIVWVQDWGRIGAAAASTSAQAGSRQVAGALPAHAPAFQAAPPLRAVWHWVSARSGSGPAQARARQQPSQPLHGLQRRHHHVHGAVMPGPLQPQHVLPRPVAHHPIVGQCRPRVLTSTLRYSTCRHEVAE